MSHIRVATGLDGEAIRRIYLSAFPEAERERVARLAVELLSEETRPETLALVAEKDDALVGHVAFSPVTADSGEEWQGYILAPLGIKPDHQGSGIGSKLIESGLARLAERGVNVLFVYGDPAYYGRFGFEPEAAVSYRPPCPLQYPFGWQAIILQEGGGEGEAVGLSCVESLRDPDLW